MAKVNLLDICIVMNSIIVFVTIRISVRLILAKVSEGGGLSAAATESLPGPAVELDLASMACC